VFFVHTMNFKCCMDPIVFQNIFFCFPQKKESHTGLKRHESE